MCVHVKCVVMYVGKCDKESIYRYFGYYDEIALVLYISKEIYSPYLLFYIIFTGNLSI